MNKSSHIAALAVAGALAGLLAGCVVTPAAPYPAYGGEVVQVAPPPPQVEVYGAPPTVGWLWISGYWGWNAGRHLWVGGHWEAPRQGYAWVPHAWVRQGPGWVQRPGYWERR